MPAGHYKKPTIDSALTHLKNGIKKIDQILESGQALKKDIESAIQHLQNAGERVAEAQADHDKARGTWRGPDFGINTNLKDLRNQLSAIQGQLQRLSDAKSARRKKNG